MSDETELIKERLDIAEVVSEYVTLKRAGQYFKGLCPFHQEKTASFIVSPDKGIWHCFGGCAEGGDVFTFIQKVEGVDFPAALKMLAERAGVTLPEYRGGAANQKAQGRRERLFELLDLTAKFYHEILINQAAGRKAREYLKKRGLSNESLAAFRLGYAPKRWDALHSWLRGKGFAPQEMVAAGVVGASGQGKTYDRFRGRIIFPINDRQGQAVALGGRIVPWHATGEEGKYINSPETEMYKKREVVFNLARAKLDLKHSRPCLVVEGYMDVVMLDQIGIKNVVASAGTAFTSEHIAQLKRFTRTLHFAFDADKAGVKAGIAATKSALAAGMRVATVMLPDGQDPADMALADPDKLKELLAAPRSLIAVLLERLAKTSEPAGREEYLEALLPLIAGVSNVVQQGEMVQEVARLLAVPESRVLGLLAGHKAAEKDLLPEAEISGASSISTERYMLGLLLERPGERRWLTELTEDMFGDRQARELLAALKAASDGLKADELVAGLPREIATFAEGLRIMAAERLSFAPDLAEREAAALLMSLKEAEVRKRLKGLQDELISGNDKQRKQALREFRAAAAKLSRLKRPVS